MAIRSDSRRLAFIAALIGLTSLAPDVMARSVYVLTTDNRIAVVQETQPGLAASTAVAVTGLNPGDVLMGIDLRPQNARLYGLGYNSAAGTVQLYHLTVDAAGVRANAVGSTGTFTTAGGIPVSVNGTSFGMDVNPAADRIRVSNNTGQNFRINPNTGAFVDGDTVNGGVQMDGAIGGLTTTVDADAYTNSIANNGGITTLYTLDSASNRLYIQTLPNDGTQTLGLLVTLGGGPTLDFAGECGFDIPVGVNAPASNAAATGNALAAFSVGGISGLYRLALSSGAATALGNFGLVARDIAITPETGPVIALNSAGDTLIRFSVFTPGFTTTQALNLAGVSPGERLVGIDGRPITGQLMALGINPTANTGSLYVIDPQTGAVALAMPGTASAIAYIDATANPIDFPDASWGFDINPAVDRIRVISNTGISFRINPITGVPVDGDLGGAAGSVPGVNPDGPINGPVGIGIAGAAYTNNVAGTTITTLYTLDPLGNRLFIQNPPNGGTQTTAKTVTLNGLTFDFDTVSGFDIPPGINAAAASADVIGEGYAVTSTGSNATLYGIELSTAALRPIGLIGSGTTPVEGLVVWSFPTELFRDGFEGGP
jgi:hypothetical protein